jgi:hypothetical protein
VNILDLFLKVIGPYILEILVVGAIVETIKKQWFVKFLHKNIRWWVNRLLPIFVSMAICLIWRLKNFDYQIYIQEIAICWAFSSLLYNFLENKLKRTTNEEESSNY